MSTCKVVVLDGLTSYADGLALQNQYLDASLAGNGEDALILLEHAPVITMGRGSASTDLLRPIDDLKRDGIDVYETDRGGEITYHGPGQVVGYPIINLERHGRDLHRYLRQVEEVIIRTLAGYGIVAGRDPGYTGVWTENRDDGQSSCASCSRKIAAIGIKARRWVTMHGFALNVDTDLTPFTRDIVPCGIRDRGVTSIALELGLATSPTPSSRGEYTVDRADVERRLIEQFEEVFGITIERV